LFFSRYIRAVVFAAPALIFLYLQNGSAQTQETKTTPEIVILETGKAVEREIAGGIKHSYRITLSENQYARAAVEQRGIDVAVRFFDPNGKLVSELDSVVTTRGEENAELLAFTAGNYRLEIEGKPKNAAAGRYEIRLAELRAGTEQEKSLQEARNLLAETSRLSRAGKHSEALHSAERALEIRQKILGAEHILTAGVINTLGLINFDMGDTEKAENHFKRAMNIYEKLLGPDNLDVAMPLNNLAVIYKVRGDFVEAETAYRRVLAIREKALGTNHNLVAAVFNNLGVLYRVRGDNAKSRNMYERALEIREALFGPDSLEVAPVLVNLGALNYYNGDFAAALKIDRRVLEIREKHLGAEDLSVVNALDNLGVVYAAGGETEKAEAAYRRALEILERLKAVESVNGASILNNFGEIYFKQGNYIKAEPLFQQAVRIAEKKSATEIGSTTLYLTNLGRLYTFKGDYEQAETLLKRALEMRERTFGENHFDVGRTYDALAQLYALKENFQQALVFQERANRIFERNIALNLATGTEHQKLSYLSLMAENLNQTINLQTKMRQTASLELAVTSVLQRKGRVLDAMTDSLAALRRRSDAQDQVLFVRLNDTNAQLAELTLKPPQDGTLAEYQKKISAIQEQKEKLEAEISRRSAGFYQPALPVTLTDVQKQIPNDAALVEFAIYRPSDAAVKEGKTPLGEPRYVVYVVRQQGEALSADLGAAREIEADVKSFRQALRDPKRKDVRQIARALDEKIMLPVRALSGDAEHLLISPEGALNLIPFEALVNENEQYLIENYSFTYLTSGRDLLRMKTSRTSKSKPLVLANPTFGEPPARQIAKSGAAQKPTTRREKKRRSVTATRDLSETYFAPLEGTAQEARSIQSIFPDATYLFEEQATESALRQATTPQILHIATHGFFLEDNENSLNQNGGAFSGKAKIENPLLRSGLALAGANRRSGGVDDGILTALESSDLNLWGTKLVVLSACDTGIGEIRNGEGVYGLRRSFVLAGAESLVMSMWSVSDSVTRELMTNYYKNLKQGMGRGAALRRVQLEMMRSTGRGHPFYWASFIQYGEWANLDGKR
jgi:CHAT domain-containing protein/Tfp pilus assembly protein PilF